MTADEARKLSDSLTGSTKKVIDEIDKKIKKAAVNGEKFVEIAVYEDHQKEKGG